MCSSGLCRAQVVCRFRSLVIWKRRRMLQWWKSQNSSPCLQQRLPERNTDALYLVTSDVLFHFHFSRPLQTKTSECIIFKRRRKKYVLLLGSDGMLWLFQSGTGLVTKPWYVCVTFSLYYYQTESAQSAWGATTEWRLSDSLRHAPLCAGRIVGDVVLALLSWRTVWDL